MCDLRSICVPIYLYMCRHTEAREFIKKRTCARAQIHTYIHMCAHSLVDKKSAGVRDSCIKLRRGDYSPMLSRSDSTQLQIYMETRLHVRAYIYCDEYARDKSVCYFMKWKNNKDTHRTHTQILITFGERPCASRVTRGCLEGEATMLDVRWYIRDFYVLQSIF